MSFEPNLPKSILITRIDDFLASTDLVDCYKRYSWERDTWSRGFPDIYRLEMMIGEAVRNKSLGVDHLLRIARWGGNNKQIYCSGIVDVPVYEGGRIAKWVEEEPERYINVICSEIRNFGPTYGSKLLRFALPSEYGAIDTWLVRVFGEGDSTKKRASFLDLKVTQNPDKRWGINSYQSRWPGEYGTWINVLRYIAKHMNENGQKCPHPDKFVDAGLRENGVWFCADVEMALFSYAISQRNLRR
nr:hypothetical protein [uncultured Methanolobus sp.]